MSEALLDETYSCQSRYVFAHELAHARYQDTLSTILLRGAGNALALCVLDLLATAWSPGGLGLFTLAGGAQPLLLPAVILLAVHVSNYMLQPLQLLFSRYKEKRADLHAMYLLGESMPMIVFFLLLRTGAQPTHINGGGVGWHRCIFGDEPKYLPAWLDRLKRTHPYHGERLAMALEWKPAAPTVQ